VATVIDSLVVKLGLDSKDFERGEKRVAEGLNKTRKQTDKIGGDVAASGKKAAEFFGQIERAAVKFFAVLTVGRGLADFTRTVISGGAQLDRLGSRLGESAAGLSRWQGAVRQSGGSAESLMATVQGLSQQFTQLKETGDAPIRMLLNQLGVSAADAAGKAKPILTLLTDIGDALEGKGWAESDKFNKLMAGGIDEGTANLLLKGAAERNRLLASQKEYSEADAKAAREAQERWEGAKLQIERTTQVLIIKMLPILERLAAGMVKFGEVSVPILEKVVSAFVAIDDATDGWSTALLLALATLRLITGAGILGGLSTLTAGLAKAGALGAAGVGGYAAGTYLNDKFISGTRAGDVIGETVARVLAFFGNEETQRAIDINTGAVAAAGAAAGGAAAGATGQSRAQRNNNPGNLEFRGQSGAVPESGTGRFAKFQSSAEGVSALVKQLQRYGTRGLDTLDKIVNTYAPASENDTEAYISALSSRLGVTGNTQLDLNNPDTLSGLVQGISRHESGSNYLSQQDILSGLQMAGVQGQPSGSAGGNTTIGEVKVYTQATDVTGIARDIKGALIRQADTGMR
jgi:hypothetical protein